MRRLLPVGLVGLVGLLAATAAAFAVAEAPRVQRHGRVASEHAPTPPHPGWRWVAYGATRIAVPSSWTIEHGFPCPSPRHGTLELGPSGIFNCPEYGSTGSLVNLAPLPPIPAPPPAGPVRTIAGVRLYEVAPSGFGRTWEAPTLGLRIYATGSGSTAVVETLEPLSDARPPSNGAQALAEPSRPTPPLGP